MNRNMRIVCGAINIALWIYVVAMECLPWV